MCKRKCVSVCVNDIQGGRERIKRKIQDDSEMHRKNSRYTNRGMEEGRDGGEDEDKEKMKEKNRGRMTISST